MQPVFTRAREALDTFDHSAERALQRLRGHPVADRVFYGASELGDFSLLWLMLGALRGLRSERGWHAAVRIGGALGIESILVNAMVKSLFRRSRPVWELERPFRLRQPRTSSFPSGHATSAFLSAGLLSDDDPFWPAFYALAAVVATSRAYVRIHHASDVVAGAALGATLGRVARRMVPLPPLPQRRPVTPR